MLCKRVSLVALLLILLFTFVTAHAEINDEIMDALSAAVNTIGNDALDGFTNEENGSVEVLKYEVIRTEKIEAGWNVYINCFGINCEHTNGEWSIVREHAAPYMIELKDGVEGIYVSGIFDVWMLCDFYDIHEYETGIEKLFCGNFDTYPGLARSRYDDLLANVTPIMDGSSCRDDIVVVCIDDD